MRSRFLTWVGFACAMLYPVNAALANRTFNFMDVALITGNTASGTLTGSFVTNDALTLLLSANVTASAAGGYIGQIYTLTNSTNNSVLPNFIQFDLNPVNSASPELRVVFSSALTPAGATLSNTSYEFEISGGERFVTTGSVVPAPVPEPATWLILLGGLGVIGSVKRGRRSRST